MSTCHNADARHAYDVHNVKLSSQNTVCKAYIVTGDLLLTIFHSYIVLLVTHFVWKYQYEAKQRGVNVRTADKVQRLLQS